MQGVPTPQSRVDARVHGYSPMYNNPPVLFRCKEVCVHDNMYTFTDLFVDGDNKTCFRLTILLQILSNLFVYDLFTNYCIK